MRLFRIVLIAFAFAFLVQGKPLPSRIPKEADVSFVFPSEELTSEGDDFTGTPNNNGWDAGLPQGAYVENEPESGTNKLSVSDSLRVSGTPDHGSQSDEPSLINSEQSFAEPKDLEIHADELLPSYTERGYYLDKGPGSKRVKRSPADIEWDSAGDENEQLSKLKWDIDKSKEKQPDLLAPNSDLDSSSFHDTDLAEDDWGSSETQDTEPETGGKYELSPDDNEWDSGAPDDMEQDSAEEWGSGGTQDTEPETGVKDELSPKDNEWDSGAPDFKEQDSAEDDWGSGGTQDTEPETGGKDELSPEDNEWDSGALDVKEQDSAEDDWGSGGNRDKEPETGGKGELSPEDNEWDSGAPDDMEQDSAEDDWGSGGTQDTEPETGDKDELSPEDNEWDSGASDVKEQDSAEDDWGSGGTQDTEPETGGKDELSPEDSEWDSGAPDDMEQDSAEDDWGSGGTKDMEPATGGKDELSLEDNEWDLGAPDDMEQDTAEDDWGSGGTQDTEPETGGKDELSPEDNEWDSGVPDDMEQDSAEDDWGSGGTQDTEPETGGKDELSPEGNKWHSGATDDMEQDSAEEWGSGVTQDKKPDTNGKDGSSDRTSNVIPESTSSEDIHKVREQIMVGRKKGTFPLKIPDTNGGILILQQKYKPGKTNGFQRHISKKKAKLMTSLASLSMAHGSNRGSNLNIQVYAVDQRGTRTKKRKEKKSEQKHSGAVANVLATLFVIGALLVMVLMAAFFLFAWPIRKYYQKLSRQMDSFDVESGQCDDCELTSIRVDRSYPPETPPASYYPQQQQEPVSTHYQTQVVTTRVKKGSDRNPASDKKKKRTREEVMTDDRKRDSRNVERRRIIKQQTSQRRGTLADSISIAKSVIDGHSRNEKFEKKASERRRVIKHCTSASSDNRRRMSFAEELQTGRSVITPNVDYTKSLERSKERCRKIKDRCTGKRRPSLAEEIGVAKGVIVDSERKYKISPIVVEQMIDEQVPRHCESYSYSDILDHILFKEKEMREYHPAPTTTNYNARAVQSQDVDELTRGISTLGLDSDDEAHWANV